MKLLGFKTQVSKKANSSKFEHFKVNYQFKQRNLAFTTGFLSLLLVMSVSSCKLNKDKKSGITITPPFKELDPRFTSIKVDPQKDSTYILENGTSISIQKNSLWNADSTEIVKPLTLKYRQFDDAVDIYLAGMPMGYGFVNENMALQTAGMFEIRTADDKKIAINPEKPISISIGSNYPSNLQGFFKLDEDNGQWELVDIPTSTVNPSKNDLVKKLEALKTEPKFPFVPNYYVFDFRRMADIFIGEKNYQALTAKNIESTRKRMDKYGAKLLDIVNYVPNIQYRGNSYSPAELLWKSSGPINVPKWVSKGPFVHKEFGERPKTVELIKVKDNVYEFRYRDNELNKSFSFRMEVVSHLRYLLKYTPEQLSAKSKIIESEIEVLEQKIKQYKLITYTVKIYSLGIYNCDYPTYFRSKTANLELKLNGKALDASDIKEITIFNKDLSSKIHPRADELAQTKLFIGSNKILVVYDENEIGLVSAKTFDKQVSDSNRIDNKLSFEIKKIKFKSAEELRLLLAE